MRAELQRHRRAGPRLLVIVAWVLTVCPAGPGRAQSIVYYQVTYTNRQIRDLAEVPPTHEGVRRVVRISRIEGPSPGYSIQSVDRGGISFVETGRTIRTELRWNGKAWVGQPEAPRTQPAAPAATSGPTAGEPAPGRVEAAIRRVKARLKAEKERLKVAEAVVVQAAAVLAEAKGREGAKPATLLLEKAQADRKKCLKRVVQLESLLSDLTGAVAPGKVVGEVRPVELQALPKQGYGIVRPIHGRRVLPFRVQAWRLPPGRGRRTYTVSMAHPEAGAFGAFYYVAYADTDGDGRPDTLIGRSPLASAQTAGGWSQWQFSTACTGGVFVGSAWPHRDVSHFCCPAGEAAGDWRGLGTDVYVGGHPAGVPGYKWSWPYLTNLRIRVHQDPD